MRRIDLIVIHCSATPNNDRLPPSPDVVIDRWHLERGFRRKEDMVAKYRPHLIAIGYHYVIGRDGSLYYGRHEDEVGAHAKDWNETSIGICLVGTDRFTKSQWKTLANIVSVICHRKNIKPAPPEFGIVGGRFTVKTPGVCGHRDLPGVAKRCPGFDVSRWLFGGMKPID